VSLALLAIDGPLEGPVNATAPNPVTVDDFAFTLGAVLRRPVLFRMPAIGLRLTLGEAADMVLHLQRVVPAKALAAGYRFRFPLLRGALEDLF
jgi:NAD dependent epimerase/dehydratase family enzyme